MFFEFFKQYIVDEFIEFDDKNCNQKDSIEGYLQVKASVLTITLWSQVWQQTDPSLCIIAFVEFAQFSQLIDSSG